MLNSKRVTESKEKTRHKNIEIGFEEVEIVDPGIRVKKNIKWDKNFTPPTEEIE